MIRSQEEMYKSLNHAFYYWCSHVVSWQKKPPSEESEQFCRALYSASIEVFPFPKKVLEIFLL